MYISFQKIIPKALIQLGIKRESNAALICEKYRKCAGKIVHAEASLHTFPKFYKNKILTIAVENSAWAAQVAKQKMALMDAINTSLGGPKSVENIRTQVMPRERFVATRESSWQ